MKIYTIRHLSTEWNDKNLLQGSKDVSIVSLSKSKKLEIQQNKTQIPQNVKVLTSTLHRTQETAHAYDIKNYIVEPLTDEFDFGEYEGKPKSKFLEEEGFHWIHQPTLVTIGEGVTNFEKRIKKFLTKYSKEEELILFGHGAFTRGLLSISMNNSIEQMNKVHINNNTLLKINIHA